jgi:hypothetical protein
VSLPPLANRNLAFTIPRYLQDDKSKSLRNLRLDDTNIGGDAVSALMRSMTDRPGEARELNLFVGANRLEISPEALASAIQDGLSPSFLSISKTDYQRETTLRGLFCALKSNSTTRSLKMGNIRLFASPHLSDETLSEIQRAFTKNGTLEVVDLSGNFSDPPSQDGELRPGIKHALLGLCKKNNLKVIDCNNQKLYYEGAFMLAEIIRNNPHLTEVHCDHTNITLAGFDELLRAIKKHSVLTYISDMEDSKVADLDELEESAFKTQLESAPSKAKQVFSSVEGKLSAKRPGKLKRPSLHPAGWERSSDDEITIRNWEGKQALLNEYLERNRRIARGEPATLQSPGYLPAGTGKERSKVRAESAGGAQQSDLKAKNMGDNIDTKSNTPTNDGNESDGRFMENLKI